MSKKPFAVVLSDEDQREIEILKSLTGIQSTADLFRSALRQWHNELEPLYSRRKTGKPKTMYETPEDRIKAKLNRAKEESDAKVALDKERQLGICQSLGGTIEEQTGGHMACTFKMYEKAGTRVLEGARTVPFDSLHESLIATQYKGGTKEEIEEILAKSKVK